MRGKNQQNSTIYATQHENKYSEISLCKNCPLPLIYLDEIPLKILSSYTTTKKDEKRRRC